MLGSVPRQVSATMDTMSTPPNAKHAVSNDRHPVVHITARITKEGS